MPKFAKRHYEALARVMQDTKPGSPCLKWWQRLFTAFGIRLWWWVKSEGAKRSFLDQGP